MEYPSVVPTNINQYLFIESKACDVCVKFIWRHFISSWMECGEEVRGNPDITVHWVGDFKLQFANVTWYLSFSSAYFPSPQVLFGMTYELIDV